MVTFKFKTKYGFTTAIVELIDKRIKFKLSPLKGFRPFPIEVIAEYNVTILKKKRKASVVLTCDCKLLSALELIRLKEKAIELLPVPKEDVDLIMNRIAKGDYSFAKYI